MLTACSTGDPADGFIAQMDQAPASEQPPQWAETKRLMMRTAPAVGDAAPDFTLPARDGSGTIQRSVHQGSRPLVLVFGSFT